MAKKTVRPDAPAASSPTSTRRRGAAGGRRTTTGRETSPGDGSNVEAVSVTPQTFHTAADMRVAGEVDSASGRTPTYEEIAEAAYRRYLERGGQHGGDFDDWLEAERSLRSGR